MSHFSTKVYYLYVRFASPGPPANQVEHEVKTLIRQIESTTDLDFEGCQVKAEIGRIDSGSDFSRTDIALINWIGSLGIDDSIYDYGGKWFHTDNAGFEFVQLRWAIRN